MSDSLTVAPTRDPRRVRAADGSILSVPAGWALLPPGDAGLTRRVKAAGPSWTVVEKKGRKAVLPRRVGARGPHHRRPGRARRPSAPPPPTPSAARPTSRRREREQAEYEVDFANAVLRFLAFAPAFIPHAKRLAVAVTAHATPVGSGTVARTERIPLERRAEAAVIAWMRHQTTALRRHAIARVKGARREVRRELAEVSRAVLDLHRRDVPHAPPACPLCTALGRLGAPAP